jgi:hypothetical protein
VPQLSGGWVIVVVEPSGGHDVVVTVTEGPLVVVVTGHPRATQESQQLGGPPATPPLAAHRCGDVTVQCMPSSAWRQHVMSFGRPQVDRLAQRITSRRQLRGSVPLRTALRTTSPTQWT